MHINVHISRQELILHQNNDAPILYLISTASKGTGQQEGSWQTPLGRHIIRAKVGTHKPIGSVFISRRFTGEIYSDELRTHYPGRTDWILSRIMWLSGLEPGFNRLGYVDTMRRYIYIHGSPDTATMGKPGSRGCIRMNSADIIDLYDRVDPGTTIDILED